MRREAHRHNDVGPQNEYPTSEKAPVADVIEARVARIVSGS